MAGKYDFSQTEEEREAEIRRIAQSSSVRYIVTEGSFIAEFPDGRVIKAPVKLSLNQIEEIDRGSGSEIDQAAAIFRLFGSQADQDYLADTDMVVALDFVRKYTDVIKRVQGATLGESSVSSPS